MNLFFKKSEARSNHTKPKIKHDKLSQNLTKSSVKNVFARHIEFRLLGITTSSILSCNSHYLPIIVSYLITKQFSQQKFGSTECKKKLSFISPVLSRH